MNRTGRESVPWGRILFLGAVVPALVIGLGLWSPLNRATAKSRPDTPEFRVDPFWPKPLPSDATQISTTTGQPKPWVTADVGGTCIDSHDRVWTVNRAFQASRIVAMSFCEPRS